MSKREWQSIGKKAGWMKKAMDPISAALMDVGAMFDNVHGDLVALRDRCQSLANNIETSNVEPGSESERMYLDLSRGAKSIDAMLGQFSDVLSPNGISREVSFTL